MKNLKMAFKFGLTVLSILLLTGLFNNKIYAQDSVKLAPEVLFSQCLNHPGIDKNFYKNKYLVIDFWATWCGPCIASFPHLDSLSRKFSSDSVVFAIMSSEEKTKVANFLAKRNINAYYLLDSVTKTSRANAKINELYGITAQSFGVHGIPHTIIIDKDNRLIWSSESSRDLNEYDLYNIIHGNGMKILAARNILKNKALTSAQQRRKIFEITKKDTIKENNATLITASLPYSDYSMSAGLDKKRQVRFIEVGGRPFEFYYEYFTGIPHTRINSSAKINSAYIRYEANADVKTEEFYATGLSLMGKAYHLKFIKKKVLVNAFKLDIIDETKFKLKGKPLQEITSGHQSSDVTDSELVFSNFNLENIGKGLEEYLNTPVLLNDACKQIRCDMTIKKGSIAQVNKFLTANYGVQLKKVKQYVEFTDIVEDAG